MTEVVEQAVAGYPEFPMARGGCPFDPPPALGALREQQPVTRVRIWDGSTPWLVTRHADVRAVLADPRVSADNRRPGYPFPSAGFAARSTQSHAFINMDNPEHGAHRKLLTSTFTVKNVEKMRPAIQRITDELIDALLAGPRPTDLVAAFALPLPSLVICELLGVPYADRDLFHRLSRVLISRTATPAEAVAAVEELLGYLRELTLTKAERPGDDLLSRLATGPLRAGTLTADEIASMARLLLVAGHETTANMIALGTVALLEHPEQLAAMRAAEDPHELAGAVEELLRYLTITHNGRRRTAREDLEVGGAHIRAGEGIVLATDVANRDPEAFPDPDALDVDRKARHHVAFGYGVHQCLGQPLARVELQIAYATLYRRVPTLALAAPREDLPFKHDMLVYGVHEVPVTW